MRSTISESSLAASAVAVLRTAAPGEKVRLTREAADAWRAGRLAVGVCSPPDRPARPARPELRPPREMPRRRAGGSAAARIALLHAVAHIELNAIDLAWDLIARFAGEALPRSFYDDWVEVADDEAHHFALLASRLGELGAAYGDLPAHDGLWEAADATADDPLARLAVVPLVLEARGLDVTPGMIDRLRRAGDEASAAVLNIIYREEIAHVAAGRRWFEFLCRRKSLAPEPAWRALVSERFRGALKPPFNHEARAAAGLATSYYEPDR